MGPIPVSLLPQNAAIGEDGRLTIGGCDLVDLAEEHGTPLFVYSEAHLRARCREAVAAFGDGVAYATKAFSTVEMVRLAYEEGMNLDVATGGELYVTHAAEIPGERVVYHGNNKSVGELRAALEVPGATAPAGLHEKLEQVCEVLQLSYTLEPLAD